MNNNALILILAISILFLLQLIILFYYLFGVKRQITLIWKKLRRQFTERSDLLILFSEFADKEISDLKPELLKIRNSAISSRLLTTTKINLEQKLFDLIENVTSRKLKNPQAIQLQSDLANINLNLKNSIISYNKSIKNYNFFVNLPILSNLFRFMKLNPFPSFQK